MARKLRVEWLIVAELKRRGWREESLRARPKGDAAKVKLAVQLRAETMRVVECLAGRLHMASRAYSHHLLWRARKLEADKNRN